MAYVQEFFEKYLPQYYLTTLREHYNKKEFFDFSNNFNVYSITLDLLNLAHHQPTNYFTRQWLSELINRQLFISYENLRLYKMPSQEGDSEIVCFMKSNLQFVKSVLMQVHNVLLQLLIRLIAIFLECFESQYLNNTTLNLIEDLTNIYPALKTQVSINCPEMNLNNFLQKYITLIITPCNSQAALLALNKVKAECNFMGQTQKLIDTIILKKKNQIQTLQKKSDFSSNQSEEESDRISKNTKENSKNFSQAEIFRKRKNKSITKTSLDTALKPTRSMQTIQATPLKIANSGSRFTPRSQRTKGKSLQIKNKNTNKSPIKKTPLFKKIKKQKKPLERTIYFGQTKKFIPKKTANSEDTFEIKQILVAGILSEHINLFDYQKKTEKKRPEEKEDLNAPLFSVPETPRVPASRILKYDKKIVPTNLFKVK